MRKKFKVVYPKGHELEGQRYKCRPKEMVVMNDQGIFFIANLEPYYTSVQPLHDVLPKYDIIWRDANGR